MIAVRVTVVAERQQEQRDPAVTRANHACSPASFPRLAARLICGKISPATPFTFEDDLAQAAHLSELTLEQTRLPLAVGLFAEDHLSLAQAVLVARLDRASFQRHLAVRGIVVAAAEQTATAQNAGTLPQDKPWLALRGSARFVGDPFAPVVSEDEITVL